MEYPWLSWQIVGLLGISLISWIVFIVTERRAVDPLLSLDLFKNRVFVVTNIVGFLMGLGMFGSLMFLPLFFQGVLGISATSSGNTMLPMMVSMMLTSIISGRFATKISFRSIYIAGMTLMALAFYLMSKMTVDTTQLTAIVYIVILGIGLGAIMPMITIAVQSAFGPERRGVATSATQFFRSIGGTLGMTVLGAIFNSYSNTILKQDFFPLVQNVPTINSRVVSDMLAKGQSDPHSLFNVLLSPDTIQMIPQNLQAVLVPPLRAALAESLHIVFWAAMVIAVAGSIVSLLMGEAKLEKKPNRTVAEEAGVTLFAEGITPEVELASELVPDLIDGDRPKKQ
jgi:MFS family permease